jgi:hypothetical protein
VAAVFIVLLIAALVVLPFTLKGDGTLAGRIRTFLAYGTGATGILLSLVTIFLSVGLVAGDVEARHVFLLASKPVGRWEYIVGRWLGVVLLDAILLAVAAVVIYGTAQHLRTGRALNREDRLAVENDVFTARAKLLPEPMTELEDRLFAEELKRLGEARLKEAAAAYVKDTGDKLTEQEARKKVEETIRSRIREGMQSAARGQSLAWRFQGIRVSGSVVSGTAKVIAQRTQYRIAVEADEPLIRQVAAARGVAVEGLWTVPAGVEADRFYVVFNDSQDPEGRLARLAGGSTVDLRIRTEKDQLISAKGRLQGRTMELLALLEGQGKLPERLLVNSFVAVEGADARVVELVDGRRFWVRFFAGSAPRAVAVVAKAGRDVGIVMHPTVQLAYKITSGASVPGNTVRGIWAAGSESSVVPPDLQDRTDPVDIRATLNIPDRVVGKSRELRVQYLNLSSSVVSILHSDVFLFSRAGSFGWNYLRASALTLLQLMFLAALGVFAASFLSFPVGCLVCFAVLPFTMARGFLAEAVKLPTSPSEKVNVLVLVGHGVLRVMEVLLPDFAETSAGDLLVDALHVSWSSLGVTAFYVVAIRSVLAIALACLIFQKRELARVQV